MTREQQGVVLFLASLLVLFFFLTSHSSPPSLPVRFVAAGDFSLKKSGEGEFLVEVDGSVNRRGVYPVARGKVYSMPSRKREGSRIKFLCLLKFFRPKLKKAVA